MQRFGQTIRALHYSLALAVSALTATALIAQEPAPIKPHQKAGLKKGDPTSFTVQVAGNVYGASVSFNVERATGLGDGKNQAQDNRPPLKWTVRRPGGKSLDCGVFEYG